MHRRWVLRQQHPEGKTALKTRRWISKKVNEWTILIHTIRGGITLRILQRWDTCRAPQTCAGNTIWLSDRELNNNRILPTQIRGQHQQHRKDKYYNARGRNQPWEHADPRRSPNGGLGGWARLRTWCRGQQCTNDLLVRAVQGRGHRVGLHLEEGHRRGRPRRRLRRWRRDGWLRRVVVTTATVRGCATVVGGERRSSRGRMAQGRWLKLDDGEGVWAWRGWHWGRHDGSRKTRAMGQDLRHAITHQPFTPRTAE